MGDHADFDLTALACALAAAAKLQVVNHDELDAVLLLHAARARTEVHDVETSRIVHVDRSGLQLAHRLHQVVGEHLLLASRHEIAVEPPHVEMRTARQHALRQLLNRHFQREDRDRMSLAVVIADGHVVHVHPQRTALGNVHRKRRLADGRTGRDDDHFAGLEPLQRLVQVLVSGRKAFHQLAAGLKHAVDALEAVVDRRGPRHRITRRATNLKERFLRVAEDDLRIRILPFVKALLHDLRRALDHEPP